MAMIAPYHSHAPWRKSVLIPFWTVQLLFLLVIIGLLSLSLGVLRSWEEDPEDDFNFDTSSMYYGVSEDTIDTTVHITLPIWIGLAGACLILTITEIVLLARHSLRPVHFVIMNVFKSGVWTALLVLDIRAAVMINASISSIAGIIIDALLFLSFWIPLIYGSVIYHRTRRQTTVYRAVDLEYSGFPKHSSMQEDSSYTNAPYPEQYRQFITQEDRNAEQGQGRPRRLSYNHQRDTRFESYRQERNSPTGQSPLERNSPTGQSTLDRMMGSPENHGYGIPQVYIQHHDEQILMGHGRRVSR